MNLIERDTFYICGYAVETTAAQNDKDVSNLYNDFFDKDKVSILLRLQGSKKGYYGLSWYTQGHEKYCYLLGVEVGKENEPPENALIKPLEKTLYASCTIAMRMSAHMRAACLAGGDRNAARRLIAIAECPKHHAPSPMGVRDGQQALSRLAS